MFNDSSLSIGVDPLVDVEKLGKQLGFTMDNKNFHSVSLGQGQEVVAEAALDTAAEHGHWVILQVRDPLIFVSTNYKIAFPCWQYHHNSSLFILKSYFM